MVDPKAGKFINSLVKSLQMLCHGYMDFKDNIEIIGHIYLRIDNSQKFDYIVNEQVSKQGDDSTYFQSNSYHSLPPSKMQRERERSASGRSEDDTLAANHHRLDDAPAGSSRVQVDLSGPVPVTRNSEASPDCFFNAATIASEIRRRSQSRDSQSLDDHGRGLGSLGMQDHAHNHSNLSGVRDLEQVERATSNGGDRVESSLYGVKDSDKSRQQECEELRAQDSSVIVKAEPGDQSRNAEMMSIPSVSSMLPMAHQSAMLSNAAHSGHAMFAATMGHHSMFDSSLATSDMAESHHGHRDPSSYRPVRNVGANEVSFQPMEAGEDLSKQNSQNRNGVAMSLVTRNRASPDPPTYPQGPMQLPQTADTAEAVRQSYVQEALMQQLINAQKQAHLSHAGKKLKAFPMSVDPTVHSTDNFLQPRPAHLKEKDRLDSNLQQEGSLSEPKPANATITTSRAASFFSPHKMKRRRRLSPGGRPESGVELARGSRKRLFNCSQCQYASVRRYNLERHIRLRHPTYQYQCPIEVCRQILLDEAELRIHLQLHDDVAGFLVCSDCGVSCKTYEDLTQHKQVCGETQRHTTQDEDNRIWSADITSDGGINAPEDGECESGDIDNKDDNGGNEGSENGDVEIVDDNLPVHFLVKQSPGSPERQESEQGEEEEDS